MKRIVLCLLAVVALGLACGQQRADALSSIRAYKVMTLTVVVTPSPAPTLAMTPTRMLAQSRFSQSFAASLAALPIFGWLLPPTIAQSSQQGNTPVQMKTQADPNAQYLHFNPGTYPGGTTLNAQYGANQYTCVFQIYAQYPTHWSLAGWAYGTGPSGSSTFPNMNYPTTSYLSWLAEPPASNNNNGAFVTLYNNGSPGQLTSQALGGGAQTFCVDIAITVPNTQAAGTYTSAIQYTLTVY